jgi:ankyrin repeat protein
MPLVQHGHQQIARHLLSHGADTSATTTSGGIPTLHLATAARDAEMARILLDHGAFIELPMGRYGLTPLHLAVGTGPGA